MHWSHLSAAKPLFLTGGIFLAEGAEMLIMGQNLMRVNCDEKLLHDLSAVLERQFQVL